jgi:hypothetical protein
MWTGVEGKVGGYTREDRTTYKQGEPAKVVII